MLTMMNAESKKLQSKSKRAVRLKDREVQWVKPQTQDHSNKVKSNEDFNYSAYKSDIINPIPQK